jgi:hypothetical protein
MVPGSLVFMGILAILILGGFLCYKDSSKKNSRSGQSKAVESQARRITRR